MILALLTAALVASPPAPPVAGGPPRARAARLQVLVLTGDGAHDWRWTSTFARQVLEDSGKFDVEVTLYPDGSLLDRVHLAQFDVLLVDYDGPRWGALAEERLLAAVEAGTGLVAVGAATTTFAQWPAWRELLGVAPTDGFASAFGLVDVSVRDAEHPVTAGLGALENHADVLLPVAATGAEGTSVLLTAGADGAPALVVGARGAGRTAAVPLGNVAVGRADTWPAQRDPQFQQLLVRAVEWAASGEVTAVRRVEPNTLTPEDRAAGWRLLFDGSSVSGWRAVGGSGFPEDTWTVQDGELRIQPGAAGGDIVTAETFTEYELELEWKIAPGGEDAACGLAVGVDDEGGPTPGLDVTLDGREDHALGWELLRPAGEYNHVRIEARRDVIRHWLNGVRLLTLHVDPGELARRLQGENLTRDPELRRSPFGRIALADRGTAVWFRNIKIRSLAPGPAGTGAAGTLAGSAAPLSLFDGQSLAGWTWVPKVNRLDPVPFDVGAAGTLRNFGLAWGYLRHDGEHRDLALELDWRYDAATRSTGEASLVLRAEPVDAAGARVDTWYRGLEVMLGPETTGNVRARGGFAVELDPGRREGDVLRRLPRRFLARPPDQWNHLEVRLEGDTLLVKVNGEVLNAAAGLERDGGMLALLAEGGPVEYRNLRLTPLAAAPGAGR